MGASFSAAGILAGVAMSWAVPDLPVAAVVALVALVAGAVPSAAFAGAVADRPETEAAGPFADRLAASPAPVRRGAVGAVRDAAVAPVAARVGLGTALVAAFFAAPLAACVAPVAASDAFVLLVVTAVILAL